MTSPAEIPQRDEALKSLVEQFEAAPASNAFVELAAALLARGHASESLRVVEHGLQLMPRSVEGRLERASALLALGRPLVAYVELLRALAIHPDHRRGLRLLGQVFRDVGEPQRAAELLTKRSALAEADPHATLEAAGPPPVTEASAGATQPAMPALFSALTKDLGLGAAAPKRTARPRVEVTQIMRRKRAPRPPRSQSELAEIDGPIVDTTQPGEIEAHELVAPSENLTAKEPAPLWNEPTPGLTDFAVDDEPLFQEHMPFAVRPVSGVPTPSSPIDAVPAPVPEPKLSGKVDTIVDDIEEPETPIETLPATKPTTPLSQDLDLPTHPTAPPPLPATPPPMPISEPKRSPMPATLTPAPKLSARTEPPAPPPKQPPPAEPRERRANPRAPTNLIPPSDTAPLGKSPASEERPFEAAGALVEKQARSSGGLSFTKPKIDKGRIALAGAAATLMLAYVLTLLFLSSESLSVWWNDAPKGSAPVEGKVDNSGARAERP